MLKCVCQYRTGSGESGSDVSQELPENSLHSGGPLCGAAWGVKPQSSPEMHRKLHFATPTYHSRHYTCIIGNFITLNMIAFPNTVLFDYFIKIHKEMLNASTIPDVIRPWHILM